MSASIPPQGQRVESYGSGNVIVQSVGEHVTINTAGQPFLTLNPASRRLRPIRPGRELDLIDPRCRALELIGRERDLSDLWSWLDDTPGPGPVSVRTLIGGAGAGKTRLALDFLLSLETDRPGQWHAGFVTGDELRRFRQSQNLSAWGWRLRTLIVVDYAAAHTEALRGWLGELAEAGSERPPLRLLLLERQAKTEEGWLRLVVQSGSRLEELFHPLEPVKLQPIATDGDRRTLLGRMLDAVALLTGQPALRLPPAGADGELDARLMADEWNDPLNLLMAALVAPQSGVRAALAFHRTDLARELADHEGRRLDAAVGEGGAAESPRWLLRHLVAYATACGGLDATQVLTVAAQECADCHREFPGGAGALAAKVVDLLGRGDGGVSALVPDIVGEAFVLRTWGGGDGKAQASTLIRAARQRGGAVAGMLTRLFQDFSSPERPRVEPLTWLDALIAAGQADEPGLLLEIEAALPQQTVELRERAASLDAMLIGRMRPLVAGTESEELQGELGRLLNNHCVRLSALGRREEAQAAVEEAVQLRRALARGRPDVFVKYLATSLNNLANSLSDLGRREEALAAAEETVQLYRGLARVRPDVFVPDLANSLNNRAIMLSALGPRKEEALADAEEAVRLHRGLARARPDALVPRLANALNTLSTMLSALYRPEEALAAIEEAVQLYRELARARPDAFVPDLATSLNNQASRLSALGSPEEALTAAEEAMRLYRELARARPDAFVPDLATSLNNLANLLCDLDRREGALTAAEEAVKLYRELAGARPDAFLPNLVRSLAVLGNSLAGLGRNTEAIAAGEEAVLLLLPAFERHPVALAKLMRTVMSYYSQWLDQAGLALDEALLPRLLAVIERLKSTGL